jgi:hypothetical protein
MEDDNESSRPSTWWERHAATMIGIILAVLLGFVMTVQVAC